MRFATVILGAAATWAVCSAGASSALAAVAIPGIPQLNIAAQPPANSAMAVRGEAKAHKVLPAEVFAVVGFPPSYGGVAEVNGYSEAGTLVEQITEPLWGPYGLATDQKGNLYVTDQNPQPPAGGGIVHVYAFGSTIDAYDLVDSGSTPIGVAVSKTGEVAVANYVGGGPGGLGAILFYKKGATQPYNAVSGQNFYDDWWVAYDKSGNLYVQGEDSAQAVHVGEIVGGGSGGTINDLNITNIRSPGGIQVLKSGNVAVGDQGARAIYEYKPASNQLVGTSSFQNSSDPVDFVLTHSEKRVWLADLGGPHGALASLWPFPAGGEPVETINLGVGSAVGGVAATPWAIP
jgi:hypothetical protein